MDSSLAESQTTRQKYAVRGWATGPRHNEPGKLAAPCLIRTIWRSQSGISHSVQCIAAADRIRDRSYPSPQFTWRDLSVRKIEGIFRHHQTRNAPIPRYATPWPLGSGVFRLTAQDLGVRSIAGPSSAPCHHLLGTLLSSTGRAWQRSTPGIRPRHFWPN